MATASIITIGDELLIGQTIDTNSAWMAQQLNKIGVWVKRRVAVGDVWDEIWTALDEESNHSQIILITGGLGPTADDITKPLLCDYFGGKMIVSDAALQNVKDIFTKLNRPIIERNLKQAEVPDVCTVLNNRRGTAPGMWFNKDGKIYVSMPGVPNEMKGIMLDYVLPQLPALFNLPIVYHQTLLTAGQGESFLAEMIKDFEEALPGYIKLAYLPNYGMVRLRLTGRGADKVAIAKEVNEKFLILKLLVKEYMVTDTDEPMELIIGKILRDHNKTMGTAESCTGGAIASLITSIPGSSNYFKGSIVSYANDVKENLLLVSADTLKTTGAVSEETVTQMVKGAINNLGVDYAVATSGILGPGGGTPEKPVGMVWVAVGNKEKTVTQKFQWRFDRQRNTDLTVQNALNMLRKFILLEQ
ncbi:MAG: CinA family nicotinamide mononucleotide deamidase-related protein [Sphingobacteriales bacterium]|nr:CinA family nicotinamide mononucleotide deamidase-related protein [Sphingobacteriales bacterium]